MLGAVCYALLVAAIVAAVLFMRRDHRRKHLAPPTMEDET